MLLIEPESFSLKDLPSNLMLVPTGHLDFPYVVNIRVPF